MLSKEELENVVQRLYQNGYVDLTDCDSIAKFVQEHFEMIDKIKTGELSDGYHTFNDLYYHRAVLFSVICNEHKDMAYKSKKHHDGTMYDGMFIVGINTSQGQYSYHYKLNLWSMFDVTELEFAPEWDGHKPSDIERLRSVNESQPYKWEDMKPNMWIWDSRLKTCFLIKEINNNFEWPIVVYRNHLDNELDGLKFEDNRFYPVQMANMKGD